MNILLYLASYGSMFALSLSVVACLLWCAAKFFRFLGRSLREWIDPASRPPKVKIDPNPYLLKRAGQ